MDSATVQHLFGRLFKTRDLVMLMVTAQAPGHSAWHVECEQQWAQPRRLITGQHFGRSAIKGDDPFAEHNVREDALRAISTSGVREFAQLLQRHATTAGKPWRVETPNLREPHGHEIDDYDHIVAYYGTTSKKVQDDHNVIAAEAQLLAKHLTKLPSIFIFRMCVEEDAACRHCKQIMERRRRANEEWSPRKVPTAWRWGS